MMRLRCTLALSLLYIKSPIAQPVLIQKVKNPSFHLSDTQTRLKSKACKIRKLARLHGDVRKRQNKL